MPTLYVVIPCFNEPTTLAPCVDGVLRAPLPPGWTRRIILVDDASKQSTRQVSQELAAKHQDSLNLIQHEVNLGKGAALRSGFARVIELAHADDSVIIQDADLEYDPCDFARLLEARSVNGAVYGDRWGGAAESPGLKRLLHRLGNRALTRISNLATGYTVSDMECCYKLLPVSLLRQVLPSLSENRFGFEPQITAILARLGAPIAEVPVSYSPRGVADGKKIGIGDGLRALWVIFRERSKGPSAMREFPPPSSMGRILVQCLALAAGLALIAACIWKAIGSGDWSRLGHADPRLIAGMLLFGLASLSINGTIFWITVRPLQRLAFWDLQSANAMATFLNYAPMRAGLIARLLYHIRVDHMHNIPLLGWMAVVAATMVVAIGSVSTATLLAPIAALTWWGIVLFGCALGAWLLRHPGRISWLRERMRGAEHIVDSRAALGWGVALRVLDIGAWIGRMACAAAILGIDLSHRDIALVAITGIVVSMNPLGRVGFREAAVAFVAARLTSGAGIDVDAIFVQLAVLESAAEAAIAIPAGLAGSARCAWRWRHR
ncbi:MAG: glycosyltransferase [Phycisphaerales bacterium]|nr:glycosyltransferase [Phycisphaerales bacterium]